MQPRDPLFESRIRESFALQKVMTTFEARLTRVEPGAVDITLPFRDDLVQQNGYLHAGVVATILDSACGYAAMSLTERGRDVLAVEFKVNFLSPAVGRDVVARGRVARAGRSVTVCNGEAWAAADGGEKRVALMLSTIMSVDARKKKS